MRAVAVAIIALLINIAVASKASWYQGERAAPNKVIPITFTLEPRNVQELERILLDHADPKSENYANWWSADEILDLVAPAATTSHFVYEYLLAHGAETAENNRDVIITSFTVAAAEELLQCRLYEWTHKNGKSKLIAADGDITYPEAISAFLDVVSGVSEFPRVSRPPTKQTDLASAYVIPLTIQKIYNIPATFEKANSSLCLAEFQNDASFNKNDLAKFVKEMAIPEIDVTNIVGPYSPSEPDAESTLDVQYGGATAVNTSVWFWTVQGWMMEFATALFAAKEVPQVVSMSWGWPEPEQCQIESCTGGLDSHKYVNRVNYEFMKIGMRGITLLAASGDQGAPGDGNAYCDNSTNPLSTIFPGASPWVISVGATMLKGQSAAQVEEVDAATPPICKTHPCATTNLAEVVCTYPTALITTGGGFSDYSPRPTWQDAVVSAYLKSGVVLPGAKFFNSSNRGFPDVSALGHNYLIGISGSFEQVDGTSCSTPVFGGVIALLNSWRAANGKRSLGYAVPMLYSAYASNNAIFTDITTGNNKCTESCCAKNGYVATKGWDPVTGLGTPQFPALLKYVQTLP